MIAQRRRKKGYKTFCYLCDKLRNWYQCSIINYTRLNNGVNDKSLLGLLDRGGLLHYSISYNIFNSELLWKTIKKNVENRQPVAMSTFKKNGKGHSVTLIGYRFRNGNKYIVIWNPGDERVQTVLYKGYGTAFQYDNAVWTWTMSLAKYIV